MAVPGQREGHHQHHWDQDKLAGHGARMRVNLRPQVRKVYALRALMRPERVTVSSTRVEKKALRGTPEWLCGWS